MEQDRREHRAPLTTEGNFLRGRKGVIVATCAAPQVAHFLKVAANAFDDLTEALDLCRGEIDLEEVARISPAIARIRTLRERIENELRNGNQS